MNMSVPIYGEIITHGAEPLQRTGLTGAGENERIRR